MKQKIIILTLALCLGLANLGRAAEPAQANAFSPLKGKLAAGKDAVLFINGDSTSYSEYGAYYKFAKTLGEAADCTVVLYRWAEWVGDRPSGPKEYQPAVTLHTGTKPGTLTVYLASLPGAVAGDMFAASRRANAIDAIPRPDCALLHHGHNMLNYPVAFKDGEGDRSSGRGLFFNVIGLTAVKWPGVPQVLVTQNPLRGGDQFTTKIYEAMREVAALHPNITLVDTHQGFIAAGKAPELYRDNIHPSDKAANSAGAQLIADTLMATWNAALPGAAISTPAWPLQPGVNLIANGDFKDWFDDAPYGWKLGGNAVAEKSVTEKYTDEPYALALRPNGNENAGLVKYFDGTESAAVRGKTITIAILVRASVSQPRVYASFVCPVGGINRTFALGDLNSGKGNWVWLVCSGIPVDEAAPEGSIYMRILPAFGLKAPTSEEPLLIQRVIVVEGKLPAGLSQPAPSGAR